MVQKSVKGWQGNYESGLRYRNSEWDENEVQSKGNRAKDILIDHKANSEKGCLGKTGVNAGWFYYIVLHSQKYKNIISYYC